jgi:RNA polymerase sigma-70 factor (ECF subfamily)
LEGADILTGQGAAERFTALYDEHRSSVYAYAASRVGRQLADEVVSDVFLVAWRRLSDVPHPPLPWLLAVARNVANSKFRAAARQQSIAAEFAAWTSDTRGADVADVVSQRLAALRALATLTEADRELLTLVAWHGLSPREAAKVVDCSTATYFVRLHRARRRLERAMDASPPSGGSGPAAEAAPGPAAEAAPGTDGAEEGHEPYRVMTAATKAPRYPERPLYSKKERTR